MFFLPNSINLEEFSPAQISNNKSWALISRLDIDKIKEIIKLISLIDSIDIKELHIFGDGSEKYFLEQYISENKLTNKVFLEGHCDNLYEKLNGNFNGLVGIGRVAMEAISMEYPTILIGYNKIAGLIDDAMYDFIKNKNFTNKYLPNVTVDTLKAQIQKVYTNEYNKGFYKLFKQDFSAQKISNQYFEKLTNINYYSLLNISELYDEIKKLTVNDSFYASTDIYQLIKKHFAIHIRQPHQKNLLVFEDTLLANINAINTQIVSQNTELINQIGNIDNKTNIEIANTNNNINSLIESVNNRFIDEEQKINNLSEHTMTYSNFKRKLKYKFNKK